MSLSAASCEAVIELLNRHYDATMPLYYCEGHLQTLQQLLLDTSPTATLKVALTQVTTIEPIVARSLEDDLAIISVPLIARLVQHRVVMPADDLEFVTGGINLLSDSRIKATTTTVVAKRARLDDDEDDETTSCSDDSDDEDEALNEAHIDEATDDHQPIQRDAVQVVRKMADLDRTQRYRMVQLMRLVLVAVHFWKHFLRDVPFTGPHEPFTDLIVRAVRPKQRRLGRKRRRSKS